MNIEYIEDFIKVAEYQSLNHASKLLNISTPALSKRIKRVEEYFEVDLFYRTSRGIFLTEYGELVLSKVKIIKSDIDELKAETSKMEMQQLELVYYQAFHCINGLSKRSIDTSKALHKN